MADNIEEDATDEKPLVTAGQVVDAAVDAVRFTHKYAKKFGVYEYTQFLASSTNSAAATPVPTLIQELNSATNEGSNVTNVQGDNLGYMRYATDSKNGRRGGSVVLHMPTDISETLEASWEDGAGVVDKLVGQGKFLTSAVTDKGAMRDAVVRQAARLTSESKLGELGKKAGFDTEGLAEDVTRRQGLAENPHSVQFFKGMSFKSHSFKHKLIAFTKEDTVMNMAIVNFFKESMKPSIKNGKFLSYPQTFTIKFLKGTELNPFLPVLRTCACTNVEVSYTGSGSWSSFRNGAPVDVDLTVQFNEMELPYGPEIKEPI
tara:strand:+ start:356 stop:1306 length:951 start_codon:yes stop_codon:yes gene_type:complete